MAMPDSDNRLPNATYHPPETVTIGDSQQVSLQLVRTIYDELTGEPRSLNRSYDDPIQVTLSDIEQLNHRFQQACKQYHIISANCSITIFYVDNTRSIFVSFDEFIKHNSGEVSPVENVIVKYNFLVIPPQEQKPQPYTISVRLVSRLALFRKMQTDFLGAPPRILRMMGNRTALIEIEYVDYMVARTLLGIIDDWFRVIPRATEKRWIELAQSYSHWVPRLAKFFTTIMLSSIIIRILPNFILENSSNLLDFSKFALYASLSMYIVYTVAGWSARTLEIAIDGWSYPSYIKLNKGDEAEITKAQRQNRGTIFKGIAGLAGVLLVNIAADFISTKLVEYLTFSPKP